MHRGDLACALLALARTEMKTAEGRARLLRGLCAAACALAELDGLPAAQMVGLLVPPEVAGALDDLAACLAMAADHAEFIAERAPGLMPASLRAAS